MLPYPVVAGIPVFATVAGELVDLLWQRRCDDAVTRASYGHLTWARATPALRTVGENFGRLSRAARVAEQGICDRELRRAGSLLTGRDG